jgi:hypothetical protein
MVANKEVACSPLKPILKLAKYKHQEKSINCIEGK